MLRLGPTAFGSAVADAFGVADEEAGGSVVMTTGGGSARPTGSVRWSPESVVSPTPISDRANRPTPIETPAPKVQATTLAAIGPGRLTAPILPWHALRPT